MNIRNAEPDITTKVHAVIVCTRSSEMFSQRPLTNSLKDHAIAAIVRERVQKTLDGMKPTDHPERKKMPAKHVFSRGSRVGFSL